MPIVPIIHELIVRKTRSPRHESNLIKEIMEKWLFLQLDFMAARLAMRVHASFQIDLVARENRAKAIGFSKFVGYIFMAFRQLAGGIIYSIAPQLPLPLTPMFTAPSFVIISFMIHEPEKREAG
jgi:hypothetical protein